jgi:hypothetical protein
MKIWKSITIDPELMEILNEIIKKFKEQKGVKPTYSNAIRALADLPLKKVKS